jgi:hypothetical protein
MTIIERLIAALALFVAAHFSKGYINSSAGGTGGILLFPFSVSSHSRWMFCSLEQSPLVLLIPLMIGLAGVAVLAFFLAILATFGLWVPGDWWRTLVLVGAASSAILLVLHPSVWVVIPLVLDAALAWVAWTAYWPPAATGGEAA